MIVGLFTGLATRGGVQIAGRQTAAALTDIANEHNWPCVLLSLNDESGERHASVAEGQFNFRGFGRRKFEFICQALNLARRKPRLIFAGHPNLASITVLMKTIGGCTRVIVGGHGVEMWQPLSSLRQNALRRADMVMVPSSYTMRKTAEVQGVLASKIRKVPWPLDFEFLRVSESRDRLPLPRGFPSGQVVLSVGRWIAEERYKGADLLIRSVSRLSGEFPSLQLVLAGPGDDVPRLRQEAQRRGASGRVHFFTVVPRSELAAFYSHADIFALPSTGEGFGIVFLEAMAFGKPIIAANAGGIPDVVEHGREGLLVEPTEEHVANALKQLLSDPALGRELGMRGKERVKNEFSFSRFEQRLRDMVNCAVENEVGTVEVKAS